MHVVTVVTGGGVEMEVNTSVDVMVVVDSDYGDVSVSLDVS